MLCLLSDCQMTSKYLQTNQSGITFNSDGKLQPLSDLRGRPVATCYGFIPSLKVKHVTDGRRDAGFIIWSQIHLYSRQKDFVSAAEALSLLVNDVITFRKTSFSGYFPAVSVVTAT